MSLRETTTPVVLPLLAANTSSHNASAKWHRSMRFRPFCRLSPPDDLSSSAVSGQSISTHWQRDDFGLSLALLTLSTPN